MIRFRAPTGKGLISLLLTYFISVPVGVVLFWRIVQDISTGKSYAILKPFTYIIISVFTIITLILIFVTLKNLKSVASKSKLRIRLIIAFGVTAILASIPQTILAYIFIQTSLKSWLPEEVADALESSKNLPITIITDKTNNITAFTETSYASSKAQEILSLGEKSWLELQKINKDIHSIQIFNAEQEEVIFLGNKKAYMKNTRSFLPTKSLSEGDGDQLITRKTFFTKNNEEYTVYYSTIISGINLETAKISKGWNKFWPVLGAKATMQRNLTLALIMFIFPIAFLIAVMSIIFSNMILQPLIKIEKAVSEVADGNFEIRIMTDKNDTLHGLSKSINTMASELENNRSSTTHTDKLAAWQDIARRLAHEINNPLTPIILSAQRLQRNFRTAEKEKLFNMIETSTASIITESENIQTMLNEFRNFSRLPKPEKEITSLARIIEEITTIYSNNPDKIINIDKSNVKYNATIFADRKQIKQALSNIIKNAIESIEKYGNIAIKSTLVSKNNTYYTRISIEDDGPGISEAIRDKLFTPYETTKKNGTGLGLAITERIIFTHGGRIWFNTSEKTGTTFFIDLPSGK
jgi:nitrogen fixation/metabolism regulation signal transduction histidine kinase